MKSSKAETHSRVHRIPTLKFAPEQRLTSYAGLVIFHALFQRLALKERLRRCFSHLSVQSIFGHHSIFMLLVVHLLLGFRRLRGLDYYRRDPLVERVVGLRRLPDVSTVSRALSAADQHSVDNVRAMLRQGVSERLGQEGMARITVDFDGSVQSTTGHAEGTAVGFNKVKKGARSYYPLFATIAQTGQFWDMHHRPGNVHDSNGAAQFMRACLRGVKEASPTSRLESRTDAAFFSEEILTELDSLDVDFSCTLPFERFPELKGIIQRRRSWSDIDDEWSFCQLPWRPKSWSEGFRVLVFRHRVKKQQKGPLQLDLFVPVEKEFEYKATVTNKPQKADSVLWFHNGRGAQEKIFGEAKQNVALDLIATHTRAGNQLFTLAGMFAHNLNRELQMQTQLRDRHAQPKRPTLWDFLQLGTIRQRLLHVAGQLTRPQGELTLTVNDHATLNKELLHYLQPSQRAA